MMYEWGYGGGYGIIGLLFMLFTVALVAIAVVLGLRYLARGSRTDMNQGQETALDILKKRYARGEISKEAFDRMKREVQ